MGSARSTPKKPYEKAIKAVDVGVLRARSLRESSSPPEHVLWKSLRSGRLGGLKFRRQHPLGPWVVDFYCHEASLVVELDSQFHEGAQLERDRAKDAWLHERRIGVVRVTASELMKNKLAVLEYILREAKTRTEQDEKTEIE
jgi:very-short-patch-repair endonuclease